jgi:hypothetical protein
MAIMLFKWLPALIFSAVHPVYISVTEINHNAAEKTLEISCKFFTDDFEEVLSKKSKTAVSITKPKNKAELDRVIAGYIYENLALKADDRPARFTYLGFETEEDVTYCYLQVDNMDALKKMEATNTLLHDLNNNQINIMHAIVGGKRISTKLDYPKSEAVFKF